MKGRYAFFSHKTALALNRAAELGELAVLPDPAVTTLPVPSLCVTNQKELKAVVEKAPHIAGYLGQGKAHLIVPGAASRSRGRRAAFHVWSDAVPERAFIRLHEHVFASSPLFAVLQMALARRPSSLTVAQIREGAAQDEHIHRELGLAPSAVSAEELLDWERARGMLQAVRVLMEFAGSYRLMGSAEGADVTYGVPHSINRADVSKFLDAWPALRGVMRARQAVGYAFDGSASPMETGLVLMLTLPPELGGYGLPRPRLNERVPEALWSLPFSSQRDIIVDLFWPEAKLVLEYDGREFHEGRGAAKITADSERKNTLAALGYAVLSATSGQVSRAGHLDLLAHQIAHLLGMELPVPTDLQRIRRTRLRTMLLPPVHGSG